MYQEKSEKLSEISGTSHINFWQTNNNLKYRLIDYLFYENYNKYVFLLID